MMDALDRLLAPHQVAALKRHWITTVDDLFSMLEEDPPAMAKLLRMSDEDTGRLRFEVREAASPEARTARAEEDTVPRAFGA